MGGIAKWNIESEGRIRSTGNAISFDEIEIEIAKKCARTIDIAAPFAVVPRRLVPTARALLNPESIQGESIRTSDISFSVQQHIRTNSFLISQIFKDIEGHSD